MIHTATAAKRTRRLPSRLAVRRQRKKSRISRNGAITRKMSTDPAGAWQRRIGKAGVETAKAETAGDGQRERRQADQRDRRRKAG